MPKMAKIVKKYFKEIHGKPGNGHKNICPILWDRYKGHFSYFNLTIQMLT